MNKEIKNYNKQLAKSDAQICDKLATVIDEQLKKAESKIWHRGPVWFLDGNPIVGYSKQKKGICLLFWSGQGFDEEPLLAAEGKFKAAQIFYNDISEIKVTHLKRFLSKSKKIQWDYKNIVKNKGKLEKLK